MKYDELVHELHFVASGVKSERYKSLLTRAADAIEELSKPGWIKFKTRPLTEEEREDHPAWDDVLDCKLPEDGQKILVYVKRRGTEFIEVDQFCDDSDGTDLSSGYALVEEATHWMPLPEPPEEAQE